MAGERTLKVTILGDADKLRGAFGDAGRAADGMNAKLTSAAKGIGLALGGAGVAAGVFGKAAVDSASDMNETVSKVGVIFGKSGDDVIKFAQTSAKSLGQSKQAALDASATFAVFGKAAGLQGPELVKFSTQMTTLASDMASFSNTSPEDAIMALGAALRGENEPIRRYGVMLDDATLKAAAMGLGIYELADGPLTAQQKALAANKVIFEQTSDAQGDFARTSEGLANKQRIATAQFEDMKTTIGQFLLPVMIELVGMFQGVTEWVGKLVDAFQKDGLNGALTFARDEFDKLLDKLGPVGNAMGKVGDAIAPVVGWFKDFARENPTAVFAALGAVIATLVLPPTIAWAASMVAAAAPVLALVAAVAALTAGVVWAYQNVDWFREAVDNVWEKIKAFGRWLSDVFSGDWDRVWRGVRDTFDAIWNGFLSFLTDWLPNKLLPKLGEIGSKALSWIGDMAPKLGTKLLEWTAAFLTWVVETMPKLLGKLGEVAVAVLKWVIDVAPDILLKLGEWTLKFLAWVNDMNLKLLGKLGDVAADLLGWILDTAAEVPGKLAEWTLKFTTWVLGLVPAILGAGADLVGWIGQKAAELPGQLAHWTAQFVAFVAGLPAAAAAAIASFAAAIGRAVLNELKDAANPANWLQSAAGALIPGSGANTGSGGFNIPGRNVVTPLPSDSDALRDLGFEVPVSRRTAASGAFVRARAGGWEFTVGEGGDDEVIAPVPMLRRVVREESGGKGGVTINVHGSVVGGTPRDIALALRDLLLQAKREGVTIGLA